MSLPINHGDVCEDEVDTPQSWGTTDVSGVSYLEDSEEILFQESTQDTITVGQEEFEQLATQVPERTPSSSSMHDVDLQSIKPPVPFVAPQGPAVESDDVESSQALESMMDEDDDQNDCIKPDRFGA